MKNHVIIYDDACPMCQAYTRGFVAVGILPEDGRKKFSEADSKMLAELDLQRARHEIPLYNRLTGKTIYGYEALFALLTEWHPIFKPLFAFPPFRGFIYYLYQLITYNRRVIAGSISPQAGFNCAPDFHYNYRLLYIFLAFSVAFLINRAVFLPIFGLGLLAMVPYWFSTLQKNVTYLGHFASVALLAQLLGLVLGVIPFLGANTCFYIEMGLFVLLLAHRVWVIRKNDMV